MAFANRILQLVSSLKDTKKHSGAHAPSPTPTLLVFAMLLLPPSLVAFVATTAATAPLAFVVPLAFVAPLPIAQERLAARRVEHERRHADDSQREQRWVK